MSGHRCSGFYLSAYTRSAVASSLGIRTGRYRVLLMENRRASRLAIDDEVVPIALSTGETTFALSALAREAASGRLVWRDLVYDHARFHAQLRVWIYADQTSTELARPSLIAAFAVFIAGMLIAIPKDAQWARSRRHGRRLKGTELVSARRFNRRMRANGIAFRQMSSLPAKLLGIRPTLRIPRAIESSHLLSWATPARKSALISAFGPDGGFTPLSVRNEERRGTFLFRAERGHFYFALTRVRSPILFLCLYNPQRPRHVAASRNAGRDLRNRRADRRRRHGRGVSSARFATRSTGRDQDAAR